jgi:hypothetical protein
VFFCGVQVPYILSGGFESLNPVADGAQSVCIIKQLGLFITGPMYTFVHLVVGSPHRKSLWRTLHVAVAYTV